MSNTKTMTETHPLSNTLVSAVIVMHNDVNIVKDTISRLAISLQKYDFFEIIAVDNCSRDDTVRLLREMQIEVPQLRIVSLFKKYDIATALTSGLDSCVGDYIVTLNIYLDEPSSISPIIERLETHDVVVGLNTNKEYYHQTSSIKMVRGLHKFLLHKDAPSDPGIFLRGFTRNAVTAITRVRRKNRYQEYLGRLIGFKNDIYTHSCPPPYPAKFTQISTFEYIWNIIDASISNSFRPLRLVSMLGFGASFINLAFLMYVFIVSLVKRNIAEGWITTSVIIGSMFFVLFTILAVICEYLLRILQETRDEPLYFISKEYDSSSLSGRGEVLNIENSNL